MVEITDAEIRNDYFRVVMYAKLAEHFANRPLAPGAGIEFGTSNCVIRGMCPGTTWEERNYPPCDITEMGYWGECDIAVADQVLEHVREPWKVFYCAGKSVRQAFIVTVPFLIKIHGCPGDYWRMTPECIRMMAEDAGFTDIHIDSWGNPEATFWLNKYWYTDAIMKHVPETEWRAALIANDPGTPIMIWAVLRR